MKKKYLFLILIPLLFLNFPLNYFSSFNIAANDASSGLEKNDENTIVVDDTITTEDSVTVYYTVNMDYFSDLSLVSLHNGKGDIMETNLYDKQDNIDQREDVLVIKDTITHTFYNPDFSEPYTGWYLTADFGIGSQNISSEDIDPFYLMTSPFFKTQSLSVDRKSNVGYVYYDLDLGLDAYGDSYVLNDHVKVTYNGEVVGADNEFYDSGTILIHNINSYDDLDNFVLKANTTYDSSTNITQKVDSPTFYLNSGEFKSISSKYYVHDDRLIISYQMYMGNNSNGEYYPLNTPNGALLVNSKNETLASDENPSQVNASGFVYGEIIIGGYSYLYEENNTNDLHLTASTSETPGDNDINSDTLSSNIIVDPEYATNVFLIVVLGSSFLLLEFLIALFFLIKKLNSKRLSRINETLDD